MPDDRHLLERVSLREEAALGEVFDMYYAPIYRYIHQHVGHDGVAEDLASEVFSRFLDSVEQGRGPADQLRAWLYRVAHNLIVDDARRQKYRSHLPLDENISAVDISVAGQAEQALLVEETRLAMANLTEEQRSVIILKYMQGLGNDEIARVLGLRVGAVRALSFRGIKTLRRELERKGVI